MAQEYEHCFFCDNLTGKAGAGDGSIYTDEGTGPFCEDCWDNFGAIVTQRDALLEACQDVIESLTLEYGEHRLKKSYPKLIAAVEKATR